MKKIDFFYEKRDLHRKMHGAIAQLVKMTKDGFVKIDNNLGYKACAYFEPNGFSDVVGIEIDAVRYDGCLKVHNDVFGMENEFSWYAVDECSDVLWCNIDSIYDSIWDTITDSDEFELIRHGKSDYLCRYVHSSEVGITEIDENILIAPESLLDSMNVIDGGENNEIDDKVYYYASDYIMDLPYKEFCDKLKESGID